MKPRHMGALWGAALIAFATMAQAQDRVLYVAGPGGSIEKSLREAVFPGFAAQTGMRVEYVAGNSTDVLAKLQAQSGNQQIDVAMIDDGPMAQAVSLGFCRDLELGDQTADIYKAAVFPDGKSIAYGLLGSGMVYNKDIFAQNGWPAPTSLADLSDPKYAGKLVIPPLNNTYGVLTLVQVAKMNGGGESNIDPGFQTFIKDIAPNVLAFEPSPGKMTELLQSGQAVLAIWGSSRAKALADTGFPAGFVYPKEGGAVIGTGICPVAGGAEKPEAQAFISYILQPDVQVKMSELSGLAPVNRKAILSEAFQVGMPYGEAQIDALVSVDWVTINAHRAEWNDRWNREVER
ncbi:MAG TPA: ABC transporter substrate-binding protein [Paenirhodobacter sp.]